MSRTAHVPGPAATFDSITGPPAGLIAEHCAYLEPGAEPVVIRAVQGPGGAVTVTLERAGVALLACRAAHVASLYRALTRVAYALGAVR